jgi:acyl-coenzyme A synthetase/AMP-(fatty) acid ligase
MGDADREFLDLGGRDRCFPGHFPVHLCVAPMTHGAGVLALMLMPKAPINVLLDRADPDLILRAIETHGVTHLYLPPTVLYALRANPGLKTAKLSSLRFFLISAAPVAPEKLRAAVQTFGPVMGQAFGQAEALFFLTFLSSDDHRRAIAQEDSPLLQSCGRPTMFSRVEIMGGRTRITGSLRARPCWVCWRMRGSREGPRSISATSATASCICAARP